MKTALLALFLAIPAFASYTPISSAPPGETDLAVIASALCPSCVRIDDDLDTTFPVPGLGPLYLVAFEDLPVGISDEDFNDAVYWLDTTLGTLTFAAGYSGDTHTASYSGGVVFLDSGQTCCGTIDSNSLTVPDRMVSFGTPIKETTIPEPSSAALTGLGFIAVAVLWSRRNRLQ